MTSGHTAPAHGGQAHGGTSAGSPGQEPGRVRHHKRCGVCQPRGLQPGQEVPQDEGVAGTASPGAQVAAAGHVPRQQHLPGVPRLGQPDDEPDPLRVGLVLLLADAVVTEEHADAGQRQQVVPDEPPVKMADADVGEVGPGRLEGPDLLDRCGAGGGVRGDRRAGLPLRRGRRPDHPVLRLGHAALGGADLDHARPDVGAVHPLGQVPHQPGDQFPLRGVLQVERSSPVVLADMPGGRHQVDPRSMREAAQPCRVAAQFHGGGLDSARPPPGGTTAAPRQPAARRRAPDRGRRAPGRPSGGSAGARGRRSARAPRRRRPQERCARTRSSGPRPASG
jgi:hypothetical protein